MQHTKVHENRSTGSKEEYFKGFLQCISAWKTSGHVTNIKLAYYISLYVKAYIQNLVKKGQVVSKKNKFLFDLGPKSRNDVDLEYSFTFIYSSSCLHLPMFWSQAAIVSKKNSVFIFSSRKVLVLKFDLAVK